VPQREITHDGFDAVWSQLPGDASLVTAVTGPAAIRFWWFISSCTNQSSLALSIGGAFQTAISGEVGWEERTFFVPPGPQEVSWRCSGGCTSTGARNVGCIDQVSVVLPEAPRVIEQPASQSLAAGETVTLRAGVDGTEPILLQWRRGDVDLPGANGLWLALTNVQSVNDAWYTLVASNPLGVVTSQVATITVVPAAPQWTQTPQDRRVSLGVGTSFAAAAKGSEPMSWQWYHGGEPIAGATSPVLVIENAQAADAGLYSVVVMNSVGQTASQPAALTVLDAPIFTRQPASQGGALGASVRFTTAAEGPGSLGWQWYFERDMLPDATNAVLLLSNVTPSLHGAYWAVVSNAYGRATSQVARLSDSPLLAWGVVGGFHDAGQFEVPPSATNLLALAAGDSHGLALRRDGSVLAWGFNAFGQTDVPPEATNVVAVSGGSDHSLALRADGIPVLWGYVLGSDYGGLNAVPPEATNVVALALGPGAQHVLALRADGTVVEWGHPGYGLPDVPDAATNVIAVSAGAYHSLALRADGALIAWGDNSYGQQRVPTAATNVVAIASGWFHNLALRADGTRVSWGTDNYIYESNPDTVSIASGAYQNLGLRSDGSVFLAGGTGSSEEPPVVPWATNCAAIGRGSYLCLALRGEDAPAFATQPRSCTALEGDTIRFVAGAVGELPLSYQWYKGNALLTGKTQPWLILPDVREADAGEYSVVASNRLGLAVSRTASLVEVTPSLPHALNVPSSIEAAAGSSVLISAQAVGTVPLRYQWRRYGTNLLDDGHFAQTQDAALLITGFQADDMGAYDVVVANDFGAVTSAVVSVRMPVTSALIREALDAPDQTWGPGKWGVDPVHARVGNLSAWAIGAAEMTTRVTGPTVVSFWWKVSTTTNLVKLRFTLSGYRPVEISGDVDWGLKSFVVPPGQQTLRWMLSQASGAQPVGDQWAWVDGFALGSGLPPAITREPLGGTVATGMPCLLSAAVSGTELLTYQWYFKGDPLVAANQPLLTIPQALPAHAGDYWLKVTNAFGETSSRTVRLDVLPDQLSVRVTSQGTIEIDWPGGTLEAAPDVDGPWTPVPSVTSPHTLHAADAAQFFRTRR